MFLCVDTYRPHACSDCSSLLLTSFLLNYICIWKKWDFFSVLSVVFLLMSVAVVKHLAWSGKWSASAVMVHDNSVKRRVLYRRKSSAPLCLHFTPVFWKSERAVVEQRAQVTDHHQSILAWLAWGREGLVGGCLKCLGLRHVVSDGGVGRVRRWDFNEL